MNALVFLFAGIIDIAVSASMYVAGSNSSHLSELKDFFWVPLPFGLICFVLAWKKYKK
jgi:hypothetical protein